MVGVGNISWSDDYIEREKVEDQKYKLYGSKEIYTNASKEEFLPKFMRLEYWLHKDIEPCWQKTESSEKEANKKFGDAVGKCISRVFFHFILLGF